tara:strand:+ start:2080 stop:3105 length:1026 start_codon:yes stop_codon:yes gene_type:complete
MRIVTKKSTWKHITFMTPKIAFMDWAKNGLEIRVNEEVFKFKTKDELHALHISLNGSFHGDDTCFISVDELKSIFNKSKRKEKIQLLNGEVYDKYKLLEKMYDDSFYYGELGKYALSSSAIKSLIDSPKSYARSLNFKSDSKVFKTGRLIHLAALEPEKLDTLCHIVEVQSAVTKKYKDKVKEVGSDQFVYTRRDYDKAMYTVDALLQNDVWQQLTRGAKLEQPGFDILHGYPFRAKADVLGKDYVADLKTTSDLKAFPYSAKKYGYDVQVYIYCNLFKVDYSNFFFFAIDKSTGDLGHYNVSEEFFESGRKKVEYGLKVFEQYFIKKKYELNEYVIKGTL